MQSSGLPVNQQYLQEMRLYKSRVFPPLMLAIGATITTFVVGAGVSVGTVPGTVHLALALLALLSNLHAGFREMRFLRCNSRLIRKIELEYLR